VRPRRVLGTAALLGGGALGYGGLWERNAFVLRRAGVAVLAPGTAPLRVLHLSDLHLTPGQQAKAAWLRGLARLAPDFTVLTGDFLSHPDATPVVLAALEPLAAFGGAFVPGNNDYHAPRWKNPVRYVTGADRSRRFGPPLDWAGCAAGLRGQGWTDLTNARADLRIAGLPVDARGVDDPYLGRDRLDAVAGAADPAAALRLGVAHAPEPRVLDAFTRDGCDLLLAGHTHGGQVRLPGYGALVTNCGIDRPRARGLAPYGAAGRTSALHVSAGVGTSPYAPVRFACRPEATLLTLEPVGAAPGDGPAAR
jgi:predicted MPP superfamily phosphohydrolase